MSLDPMLWAIKDAPLADPHELAVMVVLAETADEDGCAAFPSIATIASRAKCSPRQATRVIRELVSRGILGEGDQDAAHYIPAQYRPTVYDLLIPYEWFGNIARINEFRASKGRSPLTPESRPRIPDAPDKPRRADFGKPKPRKEKPSPAGSEPRDDYKSPQEPPSEEPQVNEDGLQVTPVDNPGGVTTRSKRGDYKVAGGVTSSHPNHPSFNHPSNPKEKNTLGQPPLFEPPGHTPQFDASPVGSVSDAQIDEWFDEFYASYPRKAGRKDARRKFASALKDRKMPVSPRELIDGARRYAEAVTGTSDRFVKHPSTWLHQGCWSDEQPKPEPQPVGANGYRPYRDPIDPAAYYADTEW